MNNLLLPYRWKIMGLLLTGCGMVLAICYLWYGFRFTMPVFAVFSSFLETKYFTVIHTNFADELIMLLLLSGLGLIVFSGEKVESEKVGLFRSEALAKALVANLVINLLSFIFIYGSGFIGALVINLFSFPLLYLLFFNFLKRNVKQTEKAMN